MKVKLSNAEVKNYVHRICVPYDKMRYLLSGKSPVGYNVGTVGWNYDVYEVRTRKGVVAIITGRNCPIELSTKKVNFYVLKKYEDEAKDCMKDNKSSIWKRLECVDEMLVEFLERF